MMVALGIPRISTLMITTIISSITITAFLIRSRMFESSFAKKSRLSQKRTRNLISFNPTNSTRIAAMSLNVKDTAMELTVSSMFCIIFCLSLFDSKF